MRDVTLLAIVLIAAFVALRKPWIGVLLWTWVSLLNPHRYTYGFAYDMPIAAIAAGSVLLGLLFTRERQWPLQSAPPQLLIVLVIWITISWIMGFDRVNDFSEYDRVMKILLMTFMALALLREKEQIFAFVWVCAGSMALIGFKGGLFTVLHGGNYRVWGPVGSFIEGNNELALALVMTIPLLRFLQLQMKRPWQRHSMTLLMVLTAASALGSHSRGALLAIVAMTILLWARGQMRLGGSIALVVVGLALVAFMPEEWTQRMNSIGAYNEDRSAQGRFAAWWVAFGIANDHFFGVGFNASRPELFAQYSPYADLGTPVAHSIYFQILGFHGWIGLAIYLAFWFCTWRVAVAVRLEAQKSSETKWASDLASMCQVSLVGYFVGGAFLNLAYFDLPYNVMVMMVVTQWWLRRRANELSNPYFSNHLAIANLSPSTNVVAHRS